MTGPDRRRELPRLIARGLGQTLITMGLVVLLYVVYEVYVTDIFSGEKQQSATAQLDRQWAGTTGSSGPAASSGSTSSAGATASGAATGRSAGGSVRPSRSGGEATEVVTVARPTSAGADGARTRHYQATIGQGFAKIYIPAFGADYVYTIIEGTGSDDLNVGPGHYSDTQYPGEPGNFAMAGHRVSKGSPFNALGQLSSCDALVIETQGDWFVYRVMPMADQTAGWKAATHQHCAGVNAATGQYAGVAGREITDPGDYAQVLPVPHVDSSGVPKNAQKLITLTTCHPQFSDAQRMIVHGVLVRSYPKSAGFLPPELQEG